MYSMGQKVGFTIKKAWYSQDVLREVGTD